MDKHQPCYAAWQAAIEAAGCIYTLCKLLCLCPWLMLMFILQVATEFTKYRHEVKVVLLVLVTDSDTYGLQRAQCSKTAKANARLVKWLLPDAFLSPVSAPCMWF